jgi:hypothetical protein
MFLSMFPPGDIPLLEVVGSSPGEIGGFFATDLVTDAGSAVRTGRARSGGSTAESPGGRGQIPNGSPTVDALPFASKIDTAGEFPSASERPEPGQDEGPREGENASADDSAEFASCIESAGEPK